MFVSMKKGNPVRFVLLFCMLIPSLARAQPLGELFTTRIDTSYIAAYRDELTTRLFLTRKQTGINLSDRLLSPWIKYRTNDHLLLGLGYTYSFLTLNLSVKFPFINTDDDLYGKSSYIDLQTHTIFRSYIIDLYLQWNKGYYIANPESVFTNYLDLPVHPQRSDLRSNIVGLNVQYLFNSERYSYKAAFLQNEFQKKSAGSPIAGAEAYWVLAMSDSATVGGNIPPIGFLADRPFNQSDILSVGLNGGYAYTFVWKETLYLSLSSLVGIETGKAWIHNTGNSETFRSGLTAGFSNSTRISLGYNTHSYYVGISLIRFSMTSRVGKDGEWMGYSTENIRFNIVKRFITRRPIKILRPDLWEL
jgi:hypothetical protein